MDENPQTVTKEIWSLNNTKTAVVEKKKERKIRDKKYNINNSTQQYTNPITIHTLIQLQLNREEKKKKKKSVSKLMT